MIALRADHSWWAGRLSLKMPQSGPLQTPQNEAGISDAGQKHASSNSRRPDNLPDPAVATTHAQTTPLPATPSQNTPPLGAFESLMQTMYSLRPSNSESSEGSNLQSVPAPPPLPASPPPTGQPIVDDTPVSSNVAESGPTASTDRDLIIILLHQMVRLVDAFDRNLQIFGGEEVVTTEMRALLQAIRSRPDYSACPINGEQYGSDEGEAGSDDGIRLSEEEVAAARSAFGQMTMLGIDEEDEDSDEEESEWQSFFLPRVNGSRKAAQIIMTHS
jgi:hypothetical protein